MLRNPAINIIFVAARRGLPNAYKALMNDHGLKARDLGEMLNLSKGTVSKILNYQNGLSKDSIRKKQVEV